ncbi:hypothetical protein [Novosphingobium sp.]|uniref:hypothetical protein n=1 Tax=Novosphingobium sp. TaxID=1874826 RepID=UPI0025F7A5B2|nr:hypothetical protein [Novosphingobium sp.]
MGGEDRVRLSPGYAPPLAASVLTCANIGGALGGLLLGFLMKRWDIKLPTVIMLFLALAGVDRLRHRV